MKKLFNKVFMGTSGYLVCRKHGVPPRLYLNWLREKWKSDLLFLWWLVKAWPLLLVAIPLWIMLVISAYILEWLPNVVPPFLQLSPDFDEGMKGAVREVRDFIFSKGSAA